MKSRSDKGKTRKPGTKSVYTRIPTKTYNSIVAESRKCGKTITQVLKERIEAGA